MFGNVVKHCLECLIDLGTKTKEKNAEIKLNDLLMSVRKLNPKLFATPLLEYHLASQTTLNEHCKFAIIRLQLVTFMMVLAVFVTILSFLLFLGPVTPKPTPSKV